MRHLIQVLAALPLLGLAACGGAQLSSREASAPITASTDGGMTQPSSRNESTSASLPLPDEMSAARPSSKVGVPVDVRYQLQSAVVRDQSTTLQLAFIPRVAGQNLRVELLPSDSVTIESGGAPFAQQKTDAAGIYRRSLVVTPRTDGPREMRVLVSMEVEGGRYFGVFYVPVSSEPVQSKPARKNR
jgi:hypothetical protein